MMQAPATMTYYVARGLAGRARSKEGQQQWQYQVIKRLERAYPVDADTHQG
jgi:hypothetical protein